MVKIKLKCHTCKKKILRNPGQLRSKSGNYYCSRRCSTISNNSLYKTWDKHPNYVDGRGSYRGAALRQYDNKCKICGYNIVEVLEVHHIDGNRKNNKMSNLVILCPTHHKEYTLNIRE